MIDISREEELSIIRNERRNYAQQSYSLVISKRIADRVSDADMAKRAIDALEKLEKMDDIAAEIEKEVLERK